MDVGGTRGSADGVIVLRTATNIVERLYVIGLYAIELRNRKVTNMTPRAATIPALVNTAIATDVEMRRVLRVNP